MWPFSLFRRSPLSPEGQEAQEQLTSVYAEDEDEVELAITALFKHYHFSRIGSIAIDKKYQHMPYQKRIFTIELVETNDLVLIEKELKRRRNAMKGRASTWKKNLQVMPLEPILDKSIEELDDMAQALTAPFPELREPKKAQKH